MYSGRNGEVFPFLSLRHSQSQFRLKHKQLGLPSVCACVIVCVCVVITVQTSAQSQVECHWHSQKARKKAVPRTGENQAQHAAFFSPLCKMESLRTERQLKSGLPARQEPNKLSCHKCRNIIKPFFLKLCIVRGLSAVPGE